jgi:hypothetical protein
MQETLQEIVALQVQYTAENTPAMQARGALIRRTLPEELRSLAPRLREAMGQYGADADAQGKDSMGQMARIPWVRWYSKSRSPSATSGWYVVYLFHPDASGVSLCLSHGSTQMEGNTFVNRGDAEVAELMDWAADVVGDEFVGDSTVRQGISLGKFDLAVGYERTTVFSKFYPSGSIPTDDVLADDLQRFVEPLAKLYRAKERGVEPGSLSPELIALREEVERFTAPLRGTSTGQGRGPSGPARKLVEYHAMSHARQWLKAEKFEFTDVSATDSCDFRARRAGQDWVVEVKGTTGGPGSILLTRNELTLHRSTHPRNALLVVHSISLSDDGARVSGGELLAFVPWEIQGDRLKPICYEYKLG